MESNLASTSKLCRVKRTDVSTIKIKSIEPIFVYNLIRIIRATRGTTTTVRSTGKLKGKAMKKSETISRSYYLILAAAVLKQTMQSSTNKTLSEVNVFHVSQTLNLLHITLSSNIWYTLGVARIYRFPHYPHTFIRGGSYQLTNG